MAEPGGTTTQSGISYQNLVAARSVSVMLSAGELPDIDRPGAVRVEAPTEVDDVVITFADGHRTFIQAKESLQATGEVWTKLWRHFAAQFTQANFRNDADWLHLVIGEEKTEFLDLKKAFDLTAGAQSEQEWYGRLSAASLKVWREKVAPLLAAEVSDRFAFAQRVRVLIGFVA
jgi:hypothetical protein